MMEHKKNQDLMSNKECIIRDIGRDETAPETSFSLSSKEFYEYIRKKTFKTSCSEQTSNESDIPNSKSLYVEHTEDYNVNNLSSFFSKLSLTDGSKSEKLTFEANEIDFQSLTLLQSKPINTSEAFVIDIHAKGEPVSHKSNSSPSLPNLEVNFNGVEPQTFENEVELSKCESPHKAVPVIDDSSNVSKNTFLVEDQSFNFRKPLDVKEKLPSEKFRKFYGVSLPFGTSSENGPLVFEDKKDALKAIKTYKGARFKEFLTKEDALDFAKQLADLIPASPVPVQKNQDIKASPESQSAFRQPTSQQTVQVRKAIEKGDFEKFTSSVWSNPMYLINGADSPTIMQEGTRYNALHVAAKYNQPKMCEKILATVENPKFLECLYPEDTEITRKNRIHHITDLYLNSVDKALLETPLHIAAKFGYLQVVKVLLSHPLCDKTKINKFGSLAKELICTRCSSDCSELKEKIEEVFEGEYYIPVLRNETNVVQPIIGKPCTLDGVKQSRASYICKPDIHEPEYSVKAYAGPMSPSAAKTFYHLWKHPSSPVSLCYSPELHKTGDNVRFTDLEKGLERIGRKLAAELNIDWEEYWPALDAWVNLTSARGLHMLESYLQKFSNILQIDEQENLSDDEDFVTPPSSPVKDGFYNFKGKSYCTPPDTPNDSDEDLSKEDINLSLLLSKEDISMFRALEHIEIDSTSYPHISMWMRIVQKHLQSSCAVKNISSYSPISPLTIGDKSRKSIRRLLF